MGPAPLVFRDQVGVPRIAAGQVTQMVVYQPNGASETETFTYNVLGQLTQASGRGSNIEYRYSATANDGRITSRKDNVSGEEVSYQYDQLGRLIAASTTGPEWGLAWVYDGFGNRLQQNVTKGTGPSAVYTVDPTTNRMTGAGITYDANGNMTGLGTGSGTATYDYFNRMVTVTTGNGTEWYGYSAANQRIQASRANGTFETFFYGLGGELLGVYQRGTKANGHYYFSSASIRVRFAGRLIDGPGGSMVTDRLGSVVKNGTETLSYYPYGEQRSGNANADREKFATYSRDAVSGLDYAWNRYYSSQFGRFTSADPYRASGGVTDPQSWNRYAYTRGNPVNRTDFTGLSDEEAPDETPVCFVNGFPIYSGEEYKCNGDPGEKEKKPKPTDIQKKARALSAAKELLPDALTRALEALKNKPCSDLFGTEETRKNGFDPSGVLASIVNGGKFGKVEFKWKNETWGVAQATVMPPFLASSGKITINTFNEKSGFWNDGKGFVNAATLLHELGHIYALLSKIAPPTPDQAHLDG